MDYAALRKRMVREQIIARGITDQKVITCFNKIERHKFIPEELRNSAYADSPVAIAEGQTISQPYIVALMTESLGLTAEEKVLEIGTGSGYQTAILAELSKKVYSIERFQGFSEKAAKMLNECGYTNINLRVGDGTLGWPEISPFDRIIITAASQRVPSPLLEQLKEEGRLIMPLGERFAQVLTLFIKKGDGFEKREICDCVFVPLVGKYA